MFEYAAEELAGDLFDALTTKDSRAAWYAGAAFTRALKVAQETYIAILTRGEPEAIARQDAMAAARDDPRYRSMLRRLDAALDAERGVSDGAE